MAQDAALKLRLKRKCIAIFDLEIADMVRNYERKMDRGSWGQENLQQAMDDVANKRTRIREAGRLYEIPERTLRRHLTQKKDTKVLCRSPQLGEEAKQKLALHIVKLQNAGFAPIETIVRKLAYRIAQILKKETTFGMKMEKKIAGKEWFWSFVRRNPSLSMRKSQGLSLARATV